MSGISRRHFVKLLGTGGAASLLGLNSGCATQPTTQSSSSPSASSAPVAAPKAAPKVVIIGGGFGGATCAKYLRVYDSGIDVTLVEQNATYTTCPGSNWVIGGLRKMDELSQNYNALRNKHGVNVVHDRVTAINADKRTVTLAGGRSLSYDRLVVSPGIDFRWNAIEGYDEAASQIIPHAWKAGPQTVLLMKQLQAMPDGGTFAMSTPPMPFRCPPGPPERISMVAHYLKTNKPRSKILLLDHKENFSKQDLFMDAWKDMYPGMIDYIPASKDGKVVRIDPKNKTLYTELGTTIRADVINIVPAQRAGDIAMASGLSGKEDGGWCPVDHQTFESKLVPGVYVIGDSSSAGPIPKSGHMANNIAKMAAASIVSAFRGGKRPPSSLVNTCYSLVGPDYGISIAAVYRLDEKGQIAGVKGAGGVSPRETTALNRTQEARFAEGWYSSIVDDSFA